MKRTHDVAVMIGSLRRNGYSQRVADALVSRSPETLALRFVPIGGLPIYNQDEDPDPPAPHGDLRSSLRRADAILFVTPEYNRGVPGGLKNAIDIGSRPYGESVFAGKPAAIVSQSPGTIGGALANHALRSTLMFLDMPTMAQPEMYLGEVAEAVGPGGIVANAAVANLIDQFLASFVSWVDLHAHGQSSREMAA